MQARTLPAGHGALWLLGAFTLFRRNPPLLTALTFAYLLLVIVLNLLPVIGPVLLPLVLPTLTAMLGNGCHAIERRQPVTIELLIRGVDTRRLSLMRLGLLNLAGSAIIILLSLVLGLNLTVNATLDQEQAKALLQNLAVVMLLATPLLMAFWFAPMLTLWNDVPAAKSVFFSLVASWRNWRAFALYGLTVAAIGLVLPALLLVLAGSIASGLVGFIALALRLAMVFVLAPVLVASVYLSYRDVFHAPPHGIDVAA